MRALTVDTYLGAITLFSNMLIAIDQEIIEGYKLALREAVAELNRLHTKAPLGNDDPIDPKTAADYLNLSTSAVYKNLNKIPHRKRHGKLYFFKSELRAYLDTGND
jgi:hypothetical protein